jgi:hypothetical protein
MPNAPNPQAKGAVLGKQQADLRDPLVTTGQVGLEFHQEIIRTDG